MVHSFSRIHPQFKSILSYLHLEPTLVATVVVDFLSHDIFVVLAERCLFRGAERVRETHDKDDNDYDPGGGSDNEEGMGRAGPTFSCVWGSADAASAPVGRHLHSDPRFAPPPLINLETLAARWNVFAARSLLQLSVGNCLAP